MSPKIPRATKNSTCVMDTSVNQENLMISQHSSSLDQEIEVQSPQCFPPSASQSQSSVQPIFMPYIEGPKKDWTVNDSLYHRFLEWKLKCENILDCELAILPESKKCKKVIVWSGDFGMDQYVLWCSKTINDSNVDLEKFPVSKVRHLAKKMESSESAARHIKAVASDPQMTQVNLMKHQRTDLPSSKSKWKQHFHKHKSKRFDPSQAHKKKRYMFKVW